MIQSDIVIIGGGLGGIMAAKTIVDIGGANVTLIDKARGQLVDRQPCCGDFLAWLPEEDSLDEWVNYYLEVGEGINYQVD